MPTETQAPNSPGPYRHTYTWRPGQVSADTVREARSFAHEWGITSTLRRQVTAYRLTFTSPTREGLKFACDYYEGMVAMLNLPMDRVFDAMPKLVADVKVPLSHIAMGIVDREQIDRHRKSHQK